MFVFVTLLLFELFHNCKVGSIQTLVGVLALGLLFQILTFFCSSLPAYLTQKAFLKTANEEI